MSKSEKLIISRPLGAQGPKIGFRIKSKEQFKQYDREMGKLNDKERRSVKGVIKAAKRAGLEVVDN